MHMNRRAALRLMGVGAAGALLLPGCLIEGEGAWPGFRNLSLSGGERKLLMALADGWIPRTDTPGALDLSAHVFALRMVDECDSATDRADFKEGLRAFAALASAKAGRAFHKLGADARARVLDVVEADRNEGGAQVFYRRYKRLVIRGYLQSEHYLRNIERYELVPGGYAGCKTV